MRNNAVLSRDLRNNSVRSGDVRDGSLTGTDVFEGGLTGADLANGSVEGMDVRDGTLGDADIGANSVSNDELTGGSVRSGEVLNGSLGTQDLQAGLLASDAGVRFAGFTVGAGQTAGEAVGCPAGQRARRRRLLWRPRPRRPRRLLRAACRRSAPNSQGAVASGWAAAIHNGGAAERTASVWVVCAAR